MRQGVLKQLWAVACLAVFMGCASSPKVKQQDYARMPSYRVFENEFPVVWKGIESALKNHKIVERDPEEVSDLELKKLTERSLETDWVYSESRDKYQEYSVNGSPRKKYLQVRYRCRVNANSVMGGTEVRIETDEEIERLNSDGTPAGYSATEQADSSLAFGLLEKVNLAILAAPSGS